MTTPGQPPNTDAEWARDTEKRLNQLESGNTVRVGPWVISAQESGLVATKPGEEIALGAVPEETAVVSDVTRGYVTDVVDSATAAITESITDNPANPNGEVALPVIRDYLSDKWSNIDDDIVDVTTTITNPETNTTRYPNLSTFLVTKWNDLSGAKSNAAGAVSTAGTASEVADSVLKSGTNLVSNPGFEKTVFTTGQGTLDTAVKRSGSRSGRLIANGGNPRLWLISDTGGQTQLACTPGDIFYVEAWVKGATTNSQTSGGAGGMGVYFDIRDSTSTQIGTSLSLIGPAASTALNTAWTKFFGYVIIPTTATYSTASFFTAYIQLNANVNVNEFYYFDDVIIRVDSLVNAWNYIFDGSNGTVGTTGKSPIDLFDPLKNVRDASLKGAGYSTALLNAGSNIVSDPGFESTSTLFNLGNGVRDTTAGIPRTGTTAARLDSTASVKKVFLLSDTAGQTTMSCTPGDIFYAEAWVRGAASNAQTSGGTSGIGLYIDVFNATGSLLGTLNMMGPAASTALNGVWSRFAAYISIPPTAPYTTAARFTAYLQINANVRSGDVYYFDDVIMRVDSLVNAWNYIFDGHSGTSGSTGKTPADLFVPIRDVRDAAVNAGDASDARSKAGSNLVSNPGFEKTIYALGDGVTETTAGLRRTGLRSAKMVATGAVRKLWLTSDATSQTQILCAPGDVFYAEAWVRGAASNTQTANGANGIQFCLDVFNSSGTKLGSTLTTTGPTAGTGLSGVWTRFVGFFIIPTTSPYTTAAQFNAYIQFNTNVNVNETYYFDDVMLRMDSLNGAWNFIYDGSNGTLGTTGKGPADLYDVSKDVRDAAVGAASKGTSIIDNIVINLRNLAQATTGYSLADLSKASYDVSAAVTALQQITTNLQTQAEAGLSAGVSYFYDFGTQAVASALPSVDWPQDLGGTPPTFSTASSTGTAQWAISDYNSAGVERATFTISGTNRSARATFTKLTQTQFQKIGVVLASSGYFTGATSQYFYIYGRVNSARTSYVYARIGRDDVQLGYRLGGSEAAIPGATKTWTGPKTGATYWLECGTSAAAMRTYRLWENNTIILEIPDGQAVTPAAATDVRAGFGGWSSSSSNVMPSVAAFSLYDNIPPTYRGSGFRAEVQQETATVVTGTTELANAKTFNVTSGSGLMPNNWYTLDYCTEDMLYNSATSNALTVSQPGFYLVTISQKGTYNDSGIGGATGRVAAAVFVDTGTGVLTLDQAGPFSAVSNLKGNFGGSFVVYLKGNNRVAPGYVSSWTTSTIQVGNNYFLSYIGSSTQSYWSVTFLHNKLTEITE